MSRLREIARMLRARLFADGTDPITGDHLTAGERASWAVQHVMRRWAFLGAITLVTIVCWSTRNDAVLTWWNLGASYAALVIEGVTAMALIQQTLRDAVVSRSVAKMERNHGEQLAEIRRLLTSDRPARDPRTGRYVKASAPVAAE